MLRVGIIGYGFATQTFHAPLIESVEGLRLQAISSSRPEEVKARHPQVAVEPDATALLARGDIDIVVIPTPNDTHHALAAAALAAGCHVVVDKPFTITLMEADDLIDRARRANRMLAVFHNRRRDADFLALQAVLVDGRLGRITHLESHFDRYRPEVRQRWREGGGPGSGLWYDLGPHLLDQALQLFGAPEAIWLDQAVQRDMARADDWFHAMLHYGPMRVVLHATTLAAVPAPRFTVHGTGGSFIKRGLDPQEDALRAGVRPGSPGWGLDPKPGELTWRNTRGDLERTCWSGPPGDYAGFYAGLRDAVLGHGTNPVPAKQAREVMRWLELGLQSRVEGRIATLPR